MYFKRICLEFERVAIAVDATDGVLLLTERGFKKESQLDGCRIKLFISNAQAKTYMEEYYHYDASVHLIKVKERVEELDTTTNKENA